MKTISAIDIKTIGVVGAGTMGGGIAQLFAQCGYRVHLAEREPALAEQGVAKIRAGLAKLVEKGKLDQQKMSDALAQIVPARELRELAETDLVIEAVTEDPGVKEAVWRQLDAICSPRAIFASNTSSLPITRLAAVTERPEQFVGMHFMNPVPVMKLVEIIRGHHTLDSVVACVMELARVLGKTPVEAHDFPGFISNRILMPMINEAIFTLQEGVGSREAIDTVMKLGMHHPMGPLELADFIGLDVCLDILNVLFDGFKDPKYRPAPLLVRMVQAGTLGRKSGRGFYIYS